VRFERSGVAARICADREQLRQVWLNLAVNALEAMKGAGTLTIRWHEADDERIAVEFVDTGPGISVDDLARVGQPFFTTKDKGTGLGLAIAQRIVERHGGMLSLQNAPGHGARATVFLPGAVAHVAQAA
jgi:signal transduction histidine kinase